MVRLALLCLGLCALGVCAAPEGKDSARSRSVAGGATPDRYGRIVLPGRVKGPLRVAVLPFRCEIPGGSEFCRNGNERVAYFIDTFPGMSLIPDGDVARAVPNHHRSGAVGYREHRVFRSRLQADVIILGKFVRNAWMVGQRVSNRIWYRMLSAHTGQFIHSSEDVIPELSTRERWKNYTGAQRDRLIGNHSAYGGPARSLRLRQTHRVRACPRDSAERRLWDHELSGKKYGPGFQYPEAADAGSIIAKTQKPLLPYYLHRPPGWEKTGWSYPLLVFLHGSGSMSDTLTPRVLMSSPLYGVLSWKGSTPSIDSARLKGMNKFLKGSFIVMPQLPKTGEPVWLAKPINEVVIAVAKQYPVDLRRVYVTGGSRGGSGTWRYGYALPGRLAALAPVAGATVVSGPTKCLDDTPTWAFHGFDDKLLGYGDTVGNMELQLQGALFWGDVELTENYPYTGSRLDQSALEHLTLPIRDSQPGEWQRGVPNPKSKWALTLFARKGHLIFGLTYSQRELWEWMYAQRLAD